MRPLRTITAATALLLAFGAPAKASTFYVSATGNDRQRGTTADRAWRTIARVNRAHLKPGDQVLFRGGDSFTDATLMPAASGVAGQPIVFGSYGTGRASIEHARAAVWFAGAEYLTFQDLDLSNGLDDGAVIAGSPTGGSAFITVRRCLIHDTRGVGILSPTPSDRGWRISRNTVRHTGDSALVIEGAGMTVASNRIVDAGWDGSISWDKHGIYVKGPRATITGNVISKFQADGISLRSRDAVVLRNTISGGQFGVAYFDADQGAGNSIVAQNHVTNVRTAFYFSRDPEPSAGPGNPLENFVLRDNVLEAYGNAAIDVTGARFSSLAIVSNVIRGPFSVAIASYSPAQGGTYGEGKNTIFGRATFAWNGVWLAYGPYRSASGQGAGDRLRPL